VVQPCILVAPKVQGSEVPNAADDRVVPALARGVLYALAQRDGRAVWAIPVGIDTTILPVRVPAVGIWPELILVVSADAETLSALDPRTGVEDWRYRLTKPCAGAPLIVERRAFVPTVDGLVHEIDLNQKGRLLGRYDLGQRLSRGGVREGKTPRLYFPADDSCVYVLNVADHKCEAILYSEHPAESLCGAPLIVGTPDDPAGKSWLILTQKQPLDDVQLRVFELPVKPRQTGELTLKPEPRVPGWSWFSPKYDGEKLAVLSDAGVLGLFGIHQARTRDAALFPFFPGSEALNLDAFLPPHSKLRGQAEVVQVQGDDLWVLTHGMLQHMQLVWDGEKGRRLVPVWKNPLLLGEPLHASQVEIDRLSGRGTLFLTTQSLRERTCLATAVDDETGLVYWQRQLGLVCQGEPVLLKAPDDDGPPLVLALDHGGGLFAFDPKRFDPQITDAWQGGGTLVAAPLENNVRFPPLLLPGPDEQSAFEIAAPGNGQELVIRQVRIGDKRQVTVVLERQVALEAPLAGAPAVAGAVLALPLADGSLYRLLWKQDGAKPELVGQDWRVRRVAADVQGHVVALGGDRFLCTDGSRGLAVYHDDKMWTPLPKGGDGAKLELKDRILTAPVVLPAAPAGPVQVCVADSGNVVTLLTVGGDGSLAMKRQWALKGRLVAGPFVRRQGDVVRLGCVVEMRKGDQRLVWLDPDEQNPCWEYRSQGREIVGQPELVEGVLVVAEESGRYVALDPQTGQPKGPGYLLKGSVAPAASPVAFGANRLFAPLSDGTVLMLSLNQLQ
jgi:outer membrane protein assembly factor BamB